MNRAGLSLLCALPLLLGACATHSHFTPRAVDARLDETMELRGGSVDVRAAPDAAGSNLIGVLGANTVSVDYAEYTQELARVLRKALDEAGARVAAGAPRSLEVAVVHVNFALGGLAGLSDRYDCFVEIRAVTSDGTTRGFVGKAGSANYAKGCNHAIAKGAREILQDPGIRDFIESGA